MTEESTLDIENKPPLDDLFAGRFNDAWSEEMEDILLARLEVRRKDLTKTELLEQVIDSIFYNQQEDVSEDAERLSRKEIARIVGSSFNRKDGTNDRINSKGEAGSGTDPSGSGATDRRESD